MLDMSEFLAQGTENSTLIYSSPKGAHWLTHLERPEIKVPSGQHGTSTSGQQRPTPRPSLSRVAQLSLAPVHVWSPCSNSLCTRVTRRLPSPEFMLAKLLAQVSSDLTDYDWVTCPFLNRSLWPGKYTMCWLSWVLLGYTLQPWAKRGSQLHQKSTWGETEVPDGFSE